MSGIRVQRWSFMGFPSTPWAYDATHLESGCDPSYDGILLAPLPSHMPAIAATNAVEDAEGFRRDNEGDESS